MINFKKYTNNSLQQQRRMLRKRSFKGLECPNCVNNIYVNELGDEYHFDILTH